MAEQMKSITDARQGLPGLSSSAGERMERYIITQKGQPQSVLLGYKDYLGMLAAVELLNQPADLGNLHRGLQQLQEGEGLTFEEMEAAVERAEANEFEPYRGQQDAARSFWRGGDHPMESVEMTLEEAPAGASEGDLTGDLAEDVARDIRPKSIRRTIEIPEIGNVEVIFTRATIGGRDTMPEENREMVRENREMTRGKRRGRRGASKARANAAREQAASDVLKSTE